MKRTAPNVIAQLMLLVITLGLVQVAGQRVARACDRVDPFEMPVEHLVSDELNDPASELAEQYAQYWGSGDPLPQILGGYISETIHTVEPVDEWTRGSVTVVTHTWGDVADLGPWVVDTVNLEGFESELPSGSCVDDIPSNGPALGRQVSVVFDDSYDSWRLRMSGTSEEIEAALTTAFGDPIAAIRDMENEQALLAGITAQRDDQSTVPVLITAGVAALLVVSYLGYRGRAHWR